MQFGQHLVFGIVACLAGGLLHAQEETDTLPPTKSILDYRTELNLTSQQQSDTRVLLDRLQESWRIAWSQVAILDYEIDSEWKSGKDVDAIRDKLDQASHLYADARCDAILCSIKVNEGLTTEQLLAWRAIQAPTKEKSLYGFGFDEPLPHVPPAPPRDAGRSIFWGPERDLGLTDRQIADIKTTLFGLQRTLKALQTELARLDQELDALVQRGGPTEQLRTRVVQEGRVRTEALCADRACSRTIDSIMTESQLESWRKIRGANSEPPRHFPR